MIHLMGIIATLLFAAFVIFMDDANWPRKEE